MILHVHGLGAPQNVRHIAGEVGVLVRVLEDCFGSPNIQVSAAIRHEQVHVIRQNSLIAPLVHIGNTVEAGPVVVFVVNARIVPVGHMLYHISFADVELVVDNETLGTPRSHRAGDTSLHPAHQVVYLYEAGPPASSRACIPCVPCCTSVPRGAVFSREAREAHISAGSFGSCGPSLPVCPIAPIAPAAASREAREAREAWESREAREAREA